LFIHKPAVVSGVHKKMNISLWKAESISLDFGDHQADLLNCKDSIISNANVKEFWDGFEEVSSMLFCLFVCLSAFT
jgi:jumonji domain-containing protein 1C